MSDFLTKEGEKFGDFVLVGYTPINELQSVLRELVHLPSGAQIMHLENEDPENVFCLSFKTLPQSSNGAPHILEHTVLCGSKKFPVKDPFFAMSRRSLNTFMNALTGSDFTCYPAATQIEKDFYNLLEVYLDAVFHPKLHRLSFLQEGHRLEFSDPENAQSALQIKGIVYNEMKGALSSADSRIWHEMLKTLVPDLPYAFNSGGEPEEIPHLTYEELIAFHEMHYHPSRCLFFFYGNFPLKKHLEFIEQHALKEVKKLPPLVGIGHQNRFRNPIVRKINYPISEEEKDLEKKYMYAFGWLTTPLLNQEEVLALTVLDSVLMDTDASPLKKALLKTNLCIQVSCFVDIEMTEIPLIFLFRGCKENQGQKIQEALFENLKKISKKGLPYPLVEAALQQLEFSRMEISGDHAPFGLTLFMRSALAKQHGCDPKHSLCLHTLFNDLSEKAKDPFFFSPLIEKYLLNNPHLVRLDCSPDPTMLTKEAEKEKIFLQKKQTELSQKQKAKIIEDTKILDEYQNRVEKQTLDCLPKVTLSDVPAEARAYPLTTQVRRSIEVYHHETFTNHIIYADLILDLPELNQQELSDLQLFISFWTEVGAKNRTYEQNLNQIYAHTGGMGAHVSQHVQATDPKIARPSLQFHGKALERQADQFFQLLLEMVTDPRYNETDRIKELVLQLHSALQNRLSRNAMRYATQISLSQFSVPNAINERWYGLSYYNYIDHLAKNIDAELKPLVERLGALKEKLLVIGSPHLILSCDASTYAKVDKNDFYGLTALLTKPFKRWQGNFPLTKVPDQARIIPSPVAFTSQAFQTIHYAHNDAPALLVSTGLLENKILHHRIREQGGAYGAGANYNPMWGNFTFYGYRDPHIAHTVHCFRDSVHEISDGNFDETDLEESKLGIIQQLDSPISPGTRGMIAYSWQRDGKTRQMRQTFRDNLLALTSEDIKRALKEHILSQIDQGKIVTFAGKGLLDKELPFLKEKKMEVFPIS